MENQFALNDYTNILELLATGCFERDLKKLMTERELQVFLSVLTSLGILKKYRAIWVSGIASSSRAPKLVKVLHGKILTRKQLELILDVDKEITKARKAGYTVSEDNLYVLTPAGVQLLRNKNE